jgi:hypothetical protein
MLLSSIRSEVKHNRASSSALAPNSNFRWVASKRTYVALNPFERSSLIEKTVVGASRWVIPDGGSREKS